MVMSRGIERSQNIGRFVASLCQQAPNNAVIAGKLANQLARQRILLSSHAHPGGSRVPENEQTKFRSFAKATLTVPFRLLQARRYPAYIAPLADKHRCQRKRRQGVQHSDYARSVVVANRAFGKQKLT